jgi:hypothetical protein
MSILLSDEKIWYAHSGNSMWSDQQKHRSIAKAAAIHAVRRLEEPCTEHPFPDSWGIAQPKCETHRYLCPDCMNQIHEEIGV